MASDDGRLKVDDAWFPLGIHDDVRETAQVQVHDACPMHTAREAFKLPQKVRRNAFRVGVKKRCPREEFRGECYSVKTKRSAGQSRYALKACEHVYLVREQGGVDKVAPRNSPKRIDFSCSGEFFSRKSFQRV